MKSSQDIRKEIETVEEQNKIKSLELFSKEFECLQEQYNCFMEFFINVKEYKFKTKNEKCFLFMHMLSTEILQRSDETQELIKRGRYSEASVMLRSIYETAFFIKYLLKNPLYWKECAEYFVLNHECLTDDSIKKTKRYKDYKNKYSLWNIMKLTGDLDYYKYYSYLCLFSHPSFEPLKQRWDVKIDKNPLYYYTPPFNQEHCKTLVNVLFGVINNNFVHFAEFMEFEEKTPPSLEKYGGNIRGWMKIFNLFYK